MSLELPNTGYNKWKSVGRSLQWVLNSGSLNRGLTVHNNYDNAVIMDNVHTVVIDEVVYLDVKETFICM